MFGFLMSIIAGAVMSIQGVFNTRLSEKTGLFESSVIVQGTAFIASLIIMLIWGKGNIKEALSVLGEYKDAYRKARLKAYEQVTTEGFKDVVSMSVLARTLGLTLDGFLREEYEEDTFSEDNYKEEVEDYLRMMSALVLNEEEIE